MAKGTAELTLHDQMLRRIAALEDAIAELRVAKPGIGHNNPPELIDPNPFWDDERGDVEAAIAVLKAQSPKPETLPAEAGEAAAKLLTTGQRVTAYTLKQCDVFVSETVKTLAKVVALSPIWVTLGDRLIEAAKAAFAWLASLPTPPH